MLEKERFLAIKKLARDIRRKNAELFDNLEDEPVEVAIRKKSDFLENTINNMASAFSSGEQGREEKQIFRANILMPDDEEFYESYSKDKNIRNLMNKYSVNIEDIMSKITELNIYGKFIDEDDDSDFVDEMVKISPKEAEDLLDEIDSLSNTLTDLDLNIKEYQDSKDYGFEEEKPLEDEKTIFEDKMPLKTKKSIFEEEKPFKTSNLNKKLLERDGKILDHEFDFESDNVVDDVLGDSFDNINTAISGFVVDYNNVKNELKQKTKYISSLETNVKNLTNENEKLKVSSEKQVKDYKELSSENTDLKTEITDLKNENSKLNKRMKILEDKLYKSATLLKKVYTGIKD